ncbi:hypothetical protein BXZ70DRAFT_323171 [Cristinia sonorae]|uniref:Uncharacterized protein n=1 Tax=Cristinia sonorae TaxID=1940300 RepID=A0A8K0UKA5_9AGAR|nr:hypothetical protein BXZ70DRAFT_323171 [Cristinia sonorae]
MLSLARVALISAGITGLLLGFAMFMTMLTVFMLTRDRRRRRVNYGMIAASITLLALALTEYAIDITRLVRGFITIGPHSSGGPRRWFYGVDDFTFIVKGCLYPFQVLILDGVVIYRAYVAWQNLWVVVIPCIGWCALFASTGGLMHSLIINPQNAPQSYSIRSSPWITALYACTLFTNFSATVLLAYRIWSVNRAASDFQRSYSRLRMLLPVVIESGAIYTILNLALLIAFRIQSPSLHYLRDILAPTVSIVFNMILVRVGFASNRGLSMFGVHRTADVSELEFPWKSDMVDSRECEPDLGVRSFVLELGQMLERDEDDDIPRPEGRTRKTSEPAVSTGVEINALPIVGGA